MSRLRNIALLLRQSLTESIRALALAVVAVTLTAGVLQAGKTQRMVGYEIRATFDGITLDGVYFDGLFFSETYFEDGSIRYHDVEGSDSGEWSVENDLFCTFYQNLTGACFFVDRDGENCFTFYEVVTDERGKPMAAEDWTSRGWNREAESTCPTPPAAEV